MRTKSQDGRRARTKGLSFERFIANELKSIFPKARRWLENHKDDCNGIDLVNTGVFKFQCKKLKRYAPIERINEIQCFQELGDIPVLVTAGDNKPPMAVLSFEHFKQMVEAVAAIEEFKDYITGRAV